MVEFTKCIRELPKDEFERSFISSCYTCKFDDMRANVARFACKYNDSYNVDDINKRIIVQDSVQNLALRSKLYYPEVYDPKLEDLEGLVTASVGVKRTLKDELNKIVLEIDLDSLFKEPWTSEGIESSLEMKKDALENILTAVLEGIDGGSVEFSDPWI